MRVRHDMVTVFVLRPGGADGSAGHELLQLRRSAGDYMGGTWAVVRGMMESDEPAPRAALRELREETALTPLQFYGLSSLDSFYTAAFETIWHCPVFVAIVSPDAQVLLNAEHDAHRWTTVAEAMPLLTWQRERELLAEITREILLDGLAKQHLLIRL